MQVVLEVLERRLDFDEAGCRTATARPDHVRTDCCASGAMPSEINKVHKLDTFTEQNRAARASVRAEIWQLQCDLNNRTTDFAQIEVRKRFMGGARSPQQSKAMGCSFIRRRHRRSISEPSSNETAGAFQSRSGRAAFLPRPELGEDARRVTCR